MPYPKGAGSQCSQILEVPFYLFVHSLSQNYQISRGNIWGGLVFRGQLRSHCKGQGPSAPQ